MAYTGNLFTQADPPHNLVTIPFAYDAAIGLWKATVDAGVATAMTAAGTLYYSLDELHRFAAMRQAFDAAATALSGAQDDVDTAAAAVTVARDAYVVAIAALAESPADEGLIAAAASATSTLGTAESTLVAAVQTLLPLLTNDGANLLDQHNGKPNPFTPTTTTAFMAN